MSTPDVFISYRREDAGWAGRLGDDLDDRVGSEHVFRDVKIPPGVDYELHIERVLDTCDVVLVVIGPRWATLTDALGNARLHDPEDLLRKEIERALQRPDVEVIPVLVQRAQMPAAGTLPEGLRALTRRQAFELTDGRWTRDLDELAGNLYGTGVTLTPVSAPSRVPWMVAAGTAGALLAGLFTNGLAAQRDMGQPDLQRLIVYSVERGLIWAFAGALALAAACIAVRGDRAGAIGWGVIGAGAGAAAGALGGAVFMLLTNYADLGDNNVRHGLSMAATGIVLGAAVARCMDGDRLAYQAAGLVGGLLGAVLALVVDMPRPGMSEGSGFLLAEALVVFGVIAAVTLAAAPAARAPQRARAQQIAG